MTSFRTLMLGAAVAGLLLVSTAPAQAPGAAPVPSWVVEVREQPGSPFVVECVFATEREAVEYAALMFLPDFRVRRVVLPESGDE